MLVLKKKLNRAADKKRVSSKWNNGGGVTVELPDQDAVTDTNDTISVSFTSYKNLGQMMSDSKTGGFIRLGVKQIIKQLT